ncbi:hypothetical protein Cni_G05751 [Canna indica]|uniref:Uncharacterized protein n=1 Tax=Canna indica TaxID=4628 RepID=A0AAQ3Q428_9LILI|nr:hypothetical protein Cni_G05751 [Canna indica]
MVVNRKKRVAPRKKIDPEIKTSNNFESIASQKENEMRSDGQHFASDLKLPLVSDALTKVLNSSHVLNPFGKGESNQKDITKNQAMEIEEFNASQDNIVPVQISVEKNVEGLHTKTN